MPSTDIILRWTTAFACGYEATAIVGRGLNAEFPLPTITSLTHSHRHNRSTYIGAGAILGLLLHHLLVEALDIGS